MYISTGCRLNFEFLEAPATRTYGRPEGRHPFPTFVILGLIEVVELPGGHAVADTLPRIAE